MLQLRRSYKALSSDVCLLCMESGETVDHIFLHCPLSLGLCNSVGLIWIEFLLRVYVT